MADQKKPKSDRDPQPTDSGRESARRGVTGEAGEYPKPFVRVRGGGSGPGGYEAEVRLVADADGAKAAKDEGFAEAEIPKQSSFIPYPRWKYHADGRAQIVNDKGEEDALDGYEDTPPEPKEGPVAPIGQAAGTASKNRPPVPADRG